MFIKNFLKRFDKKAKYSIDSTVANEMLQNVFAACNKEPNTVPFDKLVLRSKINTRSYQVGMLITTFILILTFISPLAFPHSPARISNVNMGTADFEILGHNINDGFFYLMLSGEAIDYKNSYEVTPNGSIIPATSYDQETSTLVFPYTQEEVNIYIFDFDGNVLQLLLTPKETQ